MFYKILLNFFFSLSIHRYMLFISMTTFCFQTNIAYSQTEDDEYEDDEYEDDEYEDDEYEDDEYEDDEYEEDEYEDDEYEDDEYEDDEYEDDFKIKNKKKGFSIGITSSLGLVSGSTFSNIPLVAQLFCQHHLGLKWLGLK